MEENKTIKDFHKVSNRHVLVLEAFAHEDSKREIFNLSDKLRKMNNELLSIMNRRYKQLIRTKRYRKLKYLYGQYKEELKNLSNRKDSSKNKKLIKETKEKLKEISTSLNIIQKEYNVTWDYCRKQMIKVNSKYNVNSIFALTIAENVWCSIETILYGDGKKVHFLKRGELPAIRAKQCERGITLKEDKGKLNIKIGKITLKPIIKDSFQKEEIKSIIKYLEQPEVINLKAIEEYEKGNIINTYRPCYVSLVPQIIRGKLRLFVHITIEGKAKPKRYKNGEIKHKLGKGMVGCDIGTSTIAYTSKNNVGLKNLAERGSSILQNERKEKLIQRKLDRSRRAMNPQNYNEDGTIKKNTKTFKKEWIKSKRYLKLEKQLKELSRRNAINRHLAINEDVNYIRSLGDVFITEPKNTKKLQKKAKETKRQDVSTIIEKDGSQKEVFKYKRKKRFGKSIKNRCPGYFQEKVKQKFSTTNGFYIEVPNNYKASQYDHTANDYIKKKLSTRMFNLNNGTKVQRDLYSSYLLYCYNEQDKNINKIKCTKEFNDFLEKQNKLIDYITKNHIKVLNSGI